MLLQLAIDDPASFGVVSAVAEFVDIVEVGTPVLKRFGVAGVVTLKEMASGRPILADAKIIDAGAVEARLLFGAGASLVTVLSVASMATCVAADRVAEEFGGVLVADTIAAAQLPLTADEFPPRFAYLGLHLATDRRLAGEAAADVVAQVGPMRQLGYRVAIAGGISERTIAAVVEAGPDIVVVGSAITQAASPRRMAKWMSAQLTDSGRGWPPSTKLVP